DGAIDARRRGKLGAAMHDAMADTDHAPVDQERAAELQDLRRRAVVVEPGLAPALLGHDGTCCVVRPEVRIDADALDLAAKQQGPVVAGFVERELDARRPGIEDGDAASVGGHGAMAAAGLARRAAATIKATAHDARRTSSESARLVRMMGTRAPSTMPAAS